MVSKAKYSEDEMTYKPGQIVQTGSRYYQADCWGVLHAVKKAQLLRGELK
jgi:hypothetical protein